ncbi:hypothetical protein D9619_013375 [Psilocybe cf. subviscida]|uniref:Uncharacterized protein n=1 Tax=Psilocybe cf. subviscida TaxID=2480587 RepID=A0A8H5F931_9AGAR|nr:hypothetical protein D9619_013375 [Psilocybe cf. subviscida]
MYNGWSFSSSDPFTAPKNDLDSSKTMKADPKTNKAVVKGVATIWRYIYLAPARFLNLFQPKGGAASASSPTTPAPAPVPTPGVTTANLRVESSGVISKSAEMDGSVAAHGRTTVITGSSERRNSAATREKQRASKLKEASQDRTGISTPSVSMSTPATRSEIEDKDEEEDADAHQSVLLSVSADNRCTETGKLLSMPGRKTGVDDAMPYTTLQGNEYPFLETV